MLPTTASRIGRAHRRTLRPLRNLNLVVVLLEAIASVALNVALLLGEEVLAEVSPPRRVDDVPTHLVLLIEKHDAAVLLFLHLPALGNGETNPRKTLFQII